MECSELEKAQKWMEQMKKDVGGAEKTTRPRGHSSIPGGSNMF